jgi:UDP:flavonoid glycosyltransferase YjiC (YdhE family)
VARILFVVPPLAGHVNPTVSVAAALAARGHATAWVGHAVVLRGLLPPDARIFALDERLPLALYERLQTQERAERGLVALKSLWEEVLLPLGRDMLPGVAAALADFGPDALAVDQQALAGGVAARRAGLPWATLATTSAAFGDSLDDLPLVRSWLDGLLAEFQRANGLAPLPGHNQSPHAVVVFSTPALVGGGDWPATFHFVGPSFRDRPPRDAADFPFDWLADGRPHVLVSLGTVNAERGGRFFRAVAEGFRGAAAQVVVAAPPELVPDPPPNLLVRPWVPQLALLPRLDAVVCHAGHNTVCEALAHGVPLVVAPIRDDQPVVAQQVERAGAGVRVRFARVAAAGLRAAVERVLTEPAFRAAAGRVRASFAAAGGAPAAADVLQGLAGAGAATGAP